MYMNFATWHFGPSLFGDRAGKSASGLQNLLKYTPCVEFSLGAMSDPAEPTGVEKAASAEKPKIAIPLPTQSESKAPIERSQRSQRSHRGKSPSSKRGGKSEKPEKVYAALSDRSQKTATDNLAAAGAKEEPKATSMMSIEEEGSAVPLVAEPAAAAVESAPAAASPSAAGPSAEASTPDAAAQPAAALAQEDAPKEATAVAAKAPVAVDVVASAPVKEEGAMAEGGETSPAAVTTILDSTMDAGTPAAEPKAEDKGGVAPDEVILTQAEEAKAAEPAAAAPAAVPEVVPATTASASSPDAPPDPTSEPAVGATAAAPAPAAASKNVDDELEAMVQAASRAPPANPMQEALAALAELAPPIRNVIEVATFIVFAQSQPAIDTSALYAAAVYLNDSKSRQLIETVWRGDSTSDGRPAAIKKAFDGLPKTSPYRDAVNTVERQVKMGEMKALLKLQGAEPLRITPVDEAVEARLVANVFVADRCILPPESASPWRWAERWTSVLKAGQQLGAHVLGDGLITAQLVS